MKTRITLHSFEELSFGMTVTVGLTTGRNAVNKAPTPQPRFPRPHRQLALAWPMTSGLEPGYECALNDC